MSKLKKPLGFITGSIDKHVKIWSLLGELWGDLRIVGEDPVHYWNFPYDWKEYQEKDRLEVMNVMKEIEGTVEEIELEEEDPVRVRKKRKGSDIIPKRSLAKPEVIPKARKIVFGRTKEATSTGESELKLRKKKLRYESPGTSLAQDVIALVEEYKKAPIKRRKELQQSMKTLHSRLNEESQATLKKLFEANIKPSKKQNILPMIYKKTNKDLPPILPISEKISVSTRSLAHYGTRFNSRNAASLNNTRYLALLGVSSLNTSSKISPKVTNTIQRKELTNGLIRK